MEKKQKNKKEVVKKTPQSSWVCVMDCGKFKRGDVVSDEAARNKSSFNLRYFVRSKICQ